jgi:hypothetical protein
MVMRRIELGLCGVLSLASAGTSGLLALEHATLRGAICGAGHIPHCGWCLGAAGFALAGFAALAAAARPEPVLLRA